MSALRLTLREAPAQRVDLSPLLPERLAGLAPERLAGLPLSCGNGALAVEELFDIAPGDPAELVIAGSVATLDRIGQGMTEGRIVVEGEAGAYAGLGMTGGTLHVRGSCGAAAGAGMRGGLIAIDGDAGDALGGALAGSARGMNGGTVVVRGAAGARCGDRMRRGVIVVEGGVGDFPCSRMIAGTLVALGPGTGDWPGLGMRRGTLVVSAAPARALPTFADAGSHELGFLRLLGRDYGERSPALARALGAGLRVRRLAGDLSVGGQGEILVLEG